MAARIAGLIRLTHPFPCLLDGVVVGVVATLAGADGLTAVTLGLAMTALQASIGALNDAIDAPRDAGASPASRSRPASCRRVWHTPWSSARRDSGLP